MDLNKTVFKEVFNVDCIVTAEMEENFEERTATSQSICKGLSIVPKTSYFNFTVRESRERWRKQKVAECCSAAQKLKDHFPVYCNIQQGPLLCETLVDILFPSAW